MVEILLVEDDENLNKIVNDYLTDNGYKVTSCFNGVDALEKFNEKRPNLIISDIMMPNMDGFALSQLIRKQDDKVPILFMTARDDIESKQKGYLLGIDDYIVKPFDLNELVLRIGAIMKRANIIISKKLEVGNLVMDEEEHTAYCDGEELNLTVREFNILFKLLSYPKKTFTRSQFMDLFWDYDSSATSRTVDVYMAKLRDKTMKCNGFEILTVHGLGYKVVLK